MKCELCDRNNMTAKELSIHMKYFHKQAIGAQQPQKISGGVCPDCGATLFFQEGCVNCPSCGFSKCG